jgi:hypothetical protein
MVADVSVFRAALSKADSTASQAIDDELLASIVADCRTECPDSTDHDLKSDVVRAGINVAYEILLGH